MDTPFVPERPVKTYRQLLEALKQMSDGQLDSEITAHDAAEDEYYPAELRISGSENDVLDEWHPIIHVP